MKKTIKLILLINLLSIQLLFANSASEDALDKATSYYEKKNYKQALKWSKISFKEEASKEVALNIGLAYKNLNNYNNAIKWYKKSFEMGNASGGVNLGFLYKDTFKDYQNAIKWYKKAYQLGSSKACLNLGVLFEEQKDFDSAIKWFQKGIELQSYDSLRGLGNLYYKQNENIRGAAYMLGLLGKKPEKKDKLIRYLKSKWKLSDKELEEAYELQKTLVPNPYRDSEFEEDTKKRKAGRR